MDKVCKHCKRRRGDHKAGTLHCPTGSKGRVGYTTFSPSQVFEARTERKIKLEGFKL